MAMSDCMKCWDTPCTCGWAYRSWGVSQRAELAAAVLGVKKADVIDNIKIPDHHPEKET